MSTILTKPLTTEETRALVKFTTDTAVRAMRMIRHNASILETEAAAKFVTTESLSRMLTAAMHVHDNLQELQEGAVAVGMTPGGMAQSGLHLITDASHVSDARTEEAPNQTEKETPCPLTTV